MHGQFSHVPNLAGPTFGEWIQGDSFGSKKDFLSLKYLLIYHKGTVIFGDVFFLSRFAACLFLFVCNRGNTILRQGGLHTKSNQCNQGS